MPRPKKPGAPEPKRRSRNGCWPCKARKVKCGEERPTCLNCERQGETCDYSIRLNWGGRTKKKSDDATPPASRSATDSPHSSVFSFSDESTALQYDPIPPTRNTRHARSRSSTVIPASRVGALDPELATRSGAQHQPPTYASTLQATTITFASQYDPQDGAHGRAMAAAFRGATSAPVEHRTSHFQYRGGLDYPSPSASSMESPSYPSASSFLSSTTVDSPHSPAIMPPPLRGLASANSPSQSTGCFQDSITDIEPQPKRARLSTSTETLITQPSRSLSFPDHYPAAVSSGPLTPSSPFPGQPPTPVSLSASEDGGPSRFTPMQPPPQTSFRSPADLRRMSVNSLLCETGQVFDDQSHTRQYPIADASFTTYGYDMGEPDHDMPRNNDDNAISVFSPPVSYDTNASRRQSVIAFEKGGYYAKPVPIKISKLLEPLPQKLLASPMNLLYFHHFLNHTARILVPHDCEQNPFRNVLPQMAVRDDHLLNLLLAFSASHRARLLNHPEPTTRIALWMQDVFPSMRQALLKENEPITDFTLATSIMMASLEIISPNTFEVPISWQNHLTMARRMIIARGIHQPPNKSDQVAFFLGRWFAYLDVLGSLSGSKNDIPLSSSYWFHSWDSELQIDCLLGFTSRCIGILAKIAELAKECEPSRFDDDGHVRPDWKPSDSVRAVAEKLKLDLAEGRLRVFKGCSHRLVSVAESESEVGWDSLEIYATNEAFHWAGLIHLCRRVLAKPSSDPEVQNAVREIIGALYKVRKGSSAEACLLFPMFTAGCDAVDPQQREKILARLSGVEAFGMTHVTKARTLMQKVWETGKPWETLVEDEFFG